MAKVLVVDDEADVVLLVDTMLSIDGHDVIGAATGAAALGFAPEAEVILLDIGLPDMSGLDVLKQLSAPQRRRVLVMSAHTGRDERVELASLGCAGFLDKPFDFDEMSGAIARIVSGEPAAD